ncbi:hypothetical protein ABT297_15245 [Dactylosporangium sp. NPDC000555]|uniref:hypothetical protein n=1 Tax=Dactylosporangium sp. NPDC000555 TaxID=3154260 RepID=UPI0033242AA0
MSADVSENNRDGLAQGVLIMVVFGLSWSVIAVTGLSAPAALTALLIMAAAALAGATWWTARRLRAGSPSGRPRRVSPNSRSVFTAVNAAQWVLIVASVFVVVRAGQPALLWPIVGLIVGLHFLPLAKVFDVSVYWLTGTLMMLAAVAGIVAFAYDASNGAVRAVVGFPAAVVLWSTSLLVAKRG